MSHSTAVFCLGISALPVAKKIAAFLDAELHGKTGRVSQADVFFSDAMEHLSKLFQDGIPIVGVCASAVLIRGVAKSISDKKTEPALLLLQKTEVLLYLYLVDTTVQMIWHEKFLSFWE